MALENVVSIAMVSASVALSPYHHKEIAKFRLEMVSRGWRLNRFGALSKGKHRIFFLYDRVIMKTYSLAEQEWCVLFDQKLTPETKIEVG